MIVATSPADIVARRLDVLRRRAVELDAEIRMQEQLLAAYQRTISEAIASKGSK